MNKKLYLILAMAVFFTARANAQIKTVFSNCDDISNWSASPVLDNIEKKEGVSSISTTHAGVERFVYQNTGSPVSTGGVTKQNGYLSFWFYISDASKIASGDSQIEIRSGNVGDSFELNWNAEDVLKNKFAVVNGWNKIVLSLNSGNPSGDPIDLNAITYFRIYFQTGGAEITTKIDDITFYQPNLNTFTTESTDGWEPGGVTLDLLDVKEGNASIVNKGNSNELRYKKVLSTPFDAGVTKQNGYLAFHFYVEDVSKIQDSPDGGQIEIASSQADDTEQFFWVVTPIKAGWVNGWNKVVLKLSEAEIAGGEPNLAAMRYMRIYFSTTSTMVTKIDGIQFTTDPNVLPVKLISFNAVQKMSGVALNWSTAAETNSSHFEALRSANGVDFTTVARVPSNGKGSAYSVVDNLPLVGKNYYKLLQFDNDGKSTDLGTKVLNFSLNKSEFTVYPTFITDKFNVQLAGYAGKKIAITLTDVSGKKVLSKEFVLSQGQDTFQVSKENKSLKGVYVLTVIGDGLQKMTKVVFN